MQETTPDSGSHDILLYVIHLQVIYLRQICTDAIKLSEDIILFSLKPAWMPQPLLLLALSHMVTDLSQGALPMLLPSIKDSLSLSYTQIGLLVLIQNVTSSIIQPIFGAITDKISLPWLLPFSVFLSGLGMALTGFMTTYGMLIMAVVICGLGVAGFHPQASKSAHFVSPEALRGRSMGVFSVGGNLGMALGAGFMMVLMTSPGGLNNTAWFILPVAVTALLLWRNLENVSPASFHPKSGEKSVTRKAINWNMLFLLLTFIFFRSTIHSGLSTYIPLYYVNYLNGSPVYAGYMLSLFLGGGVFGTFIGATLSDRFGRKTIIVGSMIVVFPMVVAIPFTSGVVTMILLTFVGFALISSFATTLVMSQAIMPGYEGMASGLTIGFTIGLGGLGVTILGYIADLYGIPAIFTVLSFLPVIGLFLSLPLPGRLFQKDSL
jgi:FSR family fosmidomycin resistance protein-like MFS transporter